MNAAESRFKGKVCGYVGFDPLVERHMMAGCDFLLMPSRYEPCGIPQMIAMTYGTVPIVHATGGLKDSVTDYADAPLEEANGHWIYPLSGCKMKEVLYRALDLYFNEPQKHEMLQKNAMVKNFYWPHAIDEYEKAFDWTLADAALYKV